MLGRDVQERSEQKSTAQCQTKKPGAELVKGLQTRKLSWPEALSSLFPGSLSFHPTAKHPLAPASGRDYTRAPRAPAPNSSASVSLAADPVLILALKVRTGLLSRVSGVNSWSLSPGSGWYPVLPRGVATAVVSHHRGDLGMQALAPTLDLLSHNLNIIKILFAL